MNIIFGNNNNYKCFYNIVIKKVYLPHKIIFYIFIELIIFILYESIIIITNNIYIYPFNFIFSFILSIRSWIYSLQIKEGLSNKN